MTGRKLSRYRNGNPLGTESLDISSLSDVGFLLLIYFLVTSTLDPREGDLSLTMPPPGAVSSFDSFVVDVPRITVDSAGIVSFEEEVLDRDPNRRELTLLDDRLSDFVEAFRVVSRDREPAVEVEVDDTVPGQRFVDVMNCLAGAGVTDIQLVGFTDEKP